jgi:hypothetical protein
VAIRAPHDHGDGDPPQVAHFHVPDALRDYLSHDLGTADTWLRIHPITDPDRYLSARTMVCTHVFRVTLYVMRFSVRSLYALWNEAGDVDAAACVEPSSVAERTGVPAATVKA